MSKKFKKFCCGSLKLRGGLADLANIPVLISNQILPIKIQIMNSWYYINIYIVCKVWGMWRTGVTSSYLFFWVYVSWMVCYFMEISPDTTNFAQYLASLYLSFTTQFLSPKPLPPFPATRLAHRVYRLCR